MPSTDDDTWKRLLADANIRGGRLRDARRTAATVLLIPGVPERVVMQIMGRSFTAMAARYRSGRGRTPKGPTASGGALRRIAR
ncbi:hypothetical protein [Streptomyces sp. NPDC056452]|uniref:hypothetical protein n=1 Tax=Streptomyces sp. NPDC056452 TaxID=3345821 RepID=UPI00369DE348